MTAPVDFDTFADLAAEEFELPRELISPDVDLVEGLGLDSFAVYRLIVLVEDLLDEDIPDGVIENVRTAADLYGHYERRMADVGRSGVAVFHS
jgi:acyl carrier protein